MIKRENVKIVTAKTNEELTLTQCSFQPNFISSKDIKTPVEKGDLIYRTLPSGIVEKYLVKTVDTFTNVLPHCEIKLEKID